MPWTPHRRPAGLAAGRRAAPIEPDSHAGWRLLANRLAEVATRLDSVPDSGSAVSFANKAYQVSYDTLPAIQRSRVGDPALLCLVSIPRGCPPGDDRGRVYAAANLRTLGAWSAADAEHMCGGA